MNKHTLSQPSGSNKSARIIPISAERFVPLVEKQVIQRVREAIEANMAREDFDVPFLCKEVGMSRATLHRVLKRHARQSTTHFINSLRLEKARKLLADTELNISQVAYEVGFNDPKYFSRVFTTSHHISPSSFRKWNGY